MSMMARRMMMARRSGWEPLDLPDLLIWYDFSDITTLFIDAARSMLVTADLDVIGGVTDKSGNGWHLSQTVTSNKPLYRTGIIGGKSVAQFDTSATDTLNGVGGEFSAITTEVNYTNVSSTISGTSNIGVRTILATGLQLFTPHPSVGMFFDFPSASNRLGAAFTGVIGTPYIMEIEQKTTGKTIRQNGVDVISDSVTGLTYTDVGDILTFIQTDSYMGDVIISSKSLSTDNRALLQTYLNNKWAVY